MMVFDEEKALSDIVILRAYVLARSGSKADIAAFDDAFAKYRAAVAEKIEALESLVVEWRDSVHGGEA